MVDLLDWADETLWDYPDISVSQKSSPEHRCPSEQDMYTLKIHLLVAVAPTFVQQDSSRGQF